MRKKAFDKVAPEKKCGLLIGRWQTLHEGHDWLVEQIIEKGLVPVMAIRNTVVDENNPLTATKREQAIRRRYGKKVIPIIIPDIAGVYYGRDVGYEVKELDAPDKIKKVRGRDIREKNKAEAIAAQRNRLPSTRPDNPPLDLEDMHRDMDVDDIFGVDAA